MVIVDHSMVIIKYTMVSAHLVNNQNNIRFHNWGEVKSVLKVWKWHNAYDINGEQIRVLE